jgi:ATP-binding cassette subfamily F protein uup
VAPGREKRKLSYKEQRELDGLPAQIESLEQRQQQLEETVSQADFYQRDRGDVEQVLAELADVQAALEQAFTRWAELEGED